MTIILSTETNNKDMSFLIFGDLDIEKFIKPLMEDKVPWNPVYSDFETVTWYWTVF